MLIVETLCTIRVLNYNSIFSLKYDFDVALPESTSLNRNSNALFSSLLIFLIFFIIKILLNAQTSCFTLTLLHIKNNLRSIQQRTRIFKAFCFPSYWQTVKIKGILYFIYIYYHLYKRTQNLKRRTPWRHISKAIFNSFYIFITFIWKAQLFENLFRKHLYSSFLSV